MMSGERINASRTTVDIHDAGYLNYCQEPSTAAKHARHRVGMPGGREGRLRGDACDFSPRCAGRYICTLGDSTMAWKQ